MNARAEPTASSAFALPDRLSAKRTPALIAADERHFAALAQTLRDTTADLSERLDAARRSRGNIREVVERDQEVRRLSGRLRLLRRFGLDLCLGRIVYADRPGEPVYIGRLGLTDGAGGRLLVDWRSPAAEPFFAATLAAPQGLASRRRYRWRSGQITDYWDESFTGTEAGEDAGSSAALDDQSAFIASLGAARSPRMRDVLGTIQADQDAVIRAGAEGALVVDGGPGTGKTVVALHRTAHLLYADPRLRRNRGGVLFVGPHQPYLAYISDVLPSLGEEGVQTCTLRDLVPGGAEAPAETDREAARLKSDGRMADAIEPAARFYERPPEQATDVSTPWFDLRIRPRDWAEAFGSVDATTPHNEAREEIFAALTAILADQHGSEDVTEEMLGAALRRDRELVTALYRAWPLLDPADLVGDLWTVPAYLRLCAPWLGADDVSRLQRPDAQAWTAEDLPLLDAARRRLGDPESGRLRQRHAAALAAQRERMSTVVDDLVAADDDGEGLVTMLRVEDLRTSLVDEAELPAADPDALAGPFAHIVVDEAQELTDAQWRMLLARCPSRSFTVVGDRAQARHGFGEPWRERLERVGFDRIGQASLTVNYRTPTEVMAEAEPVIRAALPDANVPMSVRSTGVPVEHGTADGLVAVLDRWRAENAEGTACVIGTPEAVAGLDAGPRVRVLTPSLAKGLEFDLVVLLAPASFGGGIEGAVDRYVAMTRSTGHLVVLDG